MQTKWVKLVEKMKKRFLYISQSCTESLKHLQPILEIKSIMKLRVMADA
jgi:hypothetical protein